MWCSLILVRTTLAAVVTAISVGYANAQQFQAVFSGLNELGALNAETGAILSTGQAKLSLTLNTQLQSLTYSLTYSGLGAPVTQAHIHFARPRVPGGIMVFLCTNLGNGPAGTPACPNPSGTVTGTLTPASVVGPVAQNITPGNFDGLVTALTTQTSYGNIHTTQFPAGEIRGDIVQCPPNGCP
jgi:CHRD domain